MVVLRGISHSFLPLTFFAGNGLPFFLSSIEDAEDLFSSFPRVGVREIKPPPPFFPARAEYTPSQKRPSGCRDPPAFFSAPASAAPPFDSYKDYSPPCAPSHPMRATIFFFPPGKKGSSSSSTKKRLFPPPLYLLTLIAFPRRIDPHWPASKHPILPALGKGVFSSFPRRQVPRVLIPPLFPPRRKKAPISSHSPENRLRWNGVSPFFSFRPTQEKSGPFFSSGFVRARLQPVSVPDDPFFS